MKEESITYSSKDKEEHDSKTTWGHTGLVRRKKPRLRPFSVVFKGKDCARVEMLSGFIIGCFYVC